MTEAIATQLSIVRLYKYEFINFDTECWSDEVLFRLANHLLFRKPRLVTLPADGFSLCISGLTQVSFHERGLDEGRRDEFNRAVFSAIESVSIMENVETQFNPIRHTLVTRPGPRLVFPLSVN